MASAAFQIEHRRPAARRAAPQVRVVQGGRYRMRRAREMARQAAVVLVVALLLGLITAIVASQARITELFLSSAQDSLSVHCISFGFKFGIPMEADLVFDVRCLPNPFYDEALRPLTGLDAPVRDYVMEKEETQGFVSRFTDLIDYLLPLYSKEGKSQLVIAVGCTGGHHRSVALAQYMCDHLTEKGVKASVTHRDMQKF